jgi:hypothetical protein
LIEVTELTEEFFDVFKSKLLVNGDEFLMFDGHRMAFIFTQLLLNIFGSKLLEDRASVDHDFKLEALIFALI